MIFLLLIITYIWPCPKKLWYLVHLKHGLPTNKIKTISLLKQTPFLQTNARSLFLLISLNFFVFFNLGHCLFTNSQFQKRLSLTPKRLINTINLLSLPPSTLYYLVSFFRFSSSTMKLSWKITRACRIILNILLK